MGDDVMALVRGTSVPEFLGPGNYGAISGALALPVTTAKAPVMVSLLWSIDGGYELPLAVLTGCAAISRVTSWMARPLALGTVRA